MGFWGKRFAQGMLCAAVIVAVFAAMSAPVVRADRRAEAREQFTRAVRLRTVLEGYLEKDRSLSDYRQTVGAFHKIYFI